MKNLLLLLAFCLTAMRAAGDAATPPLPLAILVPDAAARQMGDLLTAELSRRNDVQLLERAEIDRVYREQQLVASARDYFKLGQVLGARGLIVLDVLREGTNQFLDFRFIAVKPGVVLANERFEWSLAKSPDWPAGIARLLSPLIPKASVLASDAVPLSVVGLRSAIQSQAGRELERELTLLLLERLNRQREVFVLERRQLRALAAEKELKGMDDSAFWSGSFLLEGTIDRDGFSEPTMTISARLRAPRGGLEQSLDLSCSRANIADGVDQLAKLVLAALKLQPTAVRWSATEEAEQFRSDADWAFRWGLLEQAEAASESAWALGLRSEPLARMRIRAYADDAWRLNPWGGGNIEIPGLPDPQKLPKLSRALELFGEEWASQSGNTGRLSDQWYLLGMRLFRSSAAILDGFYRWIELRDDDQLTEVRRLSRQLLTVLETNAPSDRATLRKNRYKGPPWWDLFAELTTVDDVKWNEGGLLYDRPQDSLPLFASMLAQGYPPDKLPCIVGWHWEDRKNAPRVRQQFIAELCATTNPPARLGGLVLALAKTDFYPETTFHERENALASALWECRDWVVADLDHATLTEITEDLLRTKYSDTDPNAFFAHEPFAGVRFRLAREYFSTATNYDNQMVRALLPGAYREMPKAQAHELALAIEPLAQKNWQAISLRDDLRARAGGPFSSTNMTNAKPALPPEEPLEAKFFRWDVKSASGEPGLRLHLNRLLVRDGRLWSLGVFLQQNHMSATPLFCMSADPVTGKCGTFPFPQNLGNAENSFEISADAIYVGAHDHLARYRFASMIWDTLPVPIEGIAQMVAMGNRLYLANADTVLELDPETGATKILASARRRPPENAVDPLLDSGSRVYARSDGKLGIMASNLFFVCAPEGSAWTEIGRRVGHGYTAAYLTPDGVVLRYDDNLRRLAGFWSGNASMDLLLEQAYVPGLRLPSKTPEARRWDWPVDFDLGASCILAKTNALWILTPRKIYHGFVPQEPLKFADARQATLFCFEAGSRAPFAVPVGFQTIGVEPFDPIKGGYFFEFNSARHAEFPYWLETPAGLVFSGPDFGGHWLIPWSGLEQKLAVLREKQAQQASEDKRGSQQTAASAKQ